MPVRKFTGFFGLLAVVLVAGCASGPKTSVNNVYKAATIPNAPYSKVLVVGVGQSERNVERFEIALVSEVGGAGTSAIANHIENGEGEVSEASVKEAVERTGANAVVVTSLKQIDVDTTESAERVDVERTRRRDNLVDFFRYDYEDITTPVTVALTYNVVLTTEVFDGESGEKVYAFDSNTMDAETTFEVILLESAAIAEQLRSAGITR